MFRRLRSKSFPPAFYLRRRARSRGTARSSCSGDASLARAQLGQQTWAYRFYLSRSLPLPPSLPFSLSLSLSLSLRHECSSVARAQAGCCRFCLAIPWSLLDWRICWHGAGIAVLAYGSPCPASCGTPVASAALRTSTCCWRPGCTILRCGTPAGHHGSAPPLVSRRWAVEVGGALTAGTMQRWECVCRTFNAAGRRRCHQCHTPKPLEAAGGVPETWPCYVCGCGSTYAYRWTCHRCGAARGSPGNQPQGIPQGPSLPAASPQKQSSTDARLPATGVLTFADVVEVEDAMAAAAGQVPSASGASGIGNANADVPPSCAVLEKEREALQAQIAEIDLFFDAVGTMTDPAVLSLVAIKKLEREGLVARIRALTLNPLEAQCKLAAEARDNAARHYLECLAELQARELPMEAKRAEVENALLEVQRAQQEYDHLTRLRQAEVRNNVVPLQSGLAYAVVAPGIGGGSAPGPVSPVQAAAAMLDVLPPNLTDSFRAWLASVRADQLGTVIVQSGHCPQADDDASDRTRDGCCELDLDVTDPEAEGRRSRRPRSDPYPHAAARPTGPSGRSWGVPHVHAMQRHWQVRG